MKLFLLLLSCSIYWGCKQAVPKTTKKQASAATTPATISINYPVKKNNVIALKKKSRPAWPQMNTQARGKFFSTVITDSIIPAWIGTTWSFNGCTLSPGNGTVACGYFVTTVLQDGGLPLARIKLAQCASEEMIRTLVQPKYIQRYSNVPLDDFISSIKQQGDGLYIIGLDNHTGFIYNDGTTVWFIHSSFVGTGKVAKEQAAGNYILNSSKYKITGKISADERALERWISN